MICDGEVRLLGRWRQRQRGLLPTTAALHFAPTRVPQRPLPDATGVRVIESDGSVLLLLELDDYLATIESTVGGEAEARAALGRWSRKLTAALELDRVPPP
jgi:hypothetical protein